MLWAPYFGNMLSLLRKAIVSSRNKSKMAPNICVVLKKDMGVTLESFGTMLCVGCESPVDEEDVKERGRDINIGEINGHKY